MLIITLEAQSTRNFTKRKEVEELRKATFIFFSSLTFAKLWTSLFARGRTDVEVLMVA